MIDKKHALREFAKFLGLLKKGCPENWLFALRLKSGETLVFRVELKKRPLLRVVGNDR